MTEDLRYPIGKWPRNPAADASTCAPMIQQIAAAPAALAAAVKGLTDAQLDTPYRDGGWTPRQIVHHIADSHMNAYIRFKLCMTENQPTVKPYNEKLWAETVDGKTARSPCPCHSSTCCTTGGSSFCARSIRARTGARWCTPKTGR
jgi:hypothetical protein